MIKARTPRAVEHPSVAVGYGSLVSVTSAGSKDAVLWFQDSGGIVRAIRMGLDTSDGLAFSMKGQAILERS